MKTMLTMLIMAVVGVGSNCGEPPPVSEEKKPITVLMPKACTYPKGCYCLPVDKFVGVLVDRDGKADIFSEVSCVPDATDLGRRESFCLQVKGQDYGVQVENGRLTLGVSGHTHDVSSNQPVRCSLTAP